MFCFEICTQTKRLFIDVRLAYDICSVSIRDFEERVTAIRRWRRRRHRHRCRRRHGACRVIGGSGRVAPFADWSTGTSEGGIRRQSRKNDKNGEREDLTYSFHVWRGTLLRCPARRRWQRACANPSTLSQWRLASPTLCVDFGLNSLLTPTEEVDVVTGNNASLSAMQLLIVVRWQ